MTPLHHRLDGPADAPVLVLAPSLGTTLALWDGQVEAFSRSFQILRLDHRGQGGSPVVPGPVTIADLAADVLELLDRLGLARVSYCGLSIGGMVGMHLAATAPERVERLVLCCTAARLGPPERWEQRAATVRSEGFEPIADAIVAGWFTPAFAARRPDVVSAYRALLVHMPPEGYAALCEAVRDHDERARLAQITAPTLVVAGADDPSTPPALAEEIAAAVPGARLAVLPDAAHLANVEQPGALADAVLSHLAGGVP